MHLWSCYFIKCRIYKNGYISANFKVLVKMSDKMSGGSSGFQEIRHDDSL